MIFNQRVYWDKLKKKYYYPVYEEFNIEKRAKIISWLKEEIISYIGRKKHYQDIQDILKFTYVSKVTISKIHKNAKVQEKLPEQKFKVKNSEFIYINADDCYFPVWNKNQHPEFRFWNSIKNKLKIKRKNKVNPENLKNFLKAWKYFCNGQYDELIAFLIETKVNKDTLKIFVNNKEGIINQPAIWNIGCSAESDIQHLVKSQTKGAKIYAYPTLINMLMATANYLNSKNYINSA
ncbi:hypothetical protein [Spiroplasma endosymbiont of Danaus chrysippus]|uniref:hypothetical protein n=1 Tax=Spiroplasma endosymbiont of Danaus chrysippus TaxID=2691041 RepID=UPI00157AFC0D|nr:hypothetical protein [Spiroplasma endosymbiont of Danaus chrysippus]